MIDWNAFENNLVSYFESQRAKSEDDAAKYISELYDRYVKLGVTQYRNTIATSNTKTLKSFIFLGLTDARNGLNLQRTSQRISQGVMLYWRGVTMGVEFPPPGSIQVVTNVITFPGIPFNILIRNSTSTRALARNLTLGLKTHALTISGINTSLVPVPGGPPVPTPFPWKGLK